MNIANKLIAGLISISIVASVASFTSFASAQASVADLERQLADAQAQLKSLIATAAASNAVSVVRGSTSSSCSSWDRNLVIGSKGEDVRQLQVFLNGKSATRVATSGPGSAGKETVYYGPATSAAVTKFQEFYAADILTPLGLSRGTGSFYTSTRAKANESCAGVSSSSNQNQNRVETPVRSSGLETVVGGLRVEAAQQPRDGYAVKGAQRVPFTSIALTTGRDDVRVSGIEVKRIGLSNNKSFASVALVDQDGTQLGKSKKLNSSSRAVIGGTFFIPARKTVVVTVVGNMASDENFSSGSVSGFEIVSVNANSEVTGLTETSPIRNGAAHVNSEAIDLTVVRVEWTEDGTGTIDLNKKEEVASLNIKLLRSVRVDSDGRYVKSSTGTSNNLDEEDAYIKSITLEQDGSFDNNDLKKVTFILDDNDEDEYEAKRNGDFFTVLFEGKGYPIDEGDTISLIVEVEAVSSDTNDRVTFKLDKSSDIYVVGATYQYGLPVLIDDGTTTYVSSTSGTSYTVSAGDISRERRTNLDRNEFDISYGDDVLLGAISYEIEGESVEIQEPSFTLEISGLPTTFPSDVDELEIRNIFLEVNGEAVARLDEDVSFSDPSTGTTYLSPVIASSDSFTVRRGREEVLFTLRGDLNSGWSQFDNAEILVKMVDADNIEGIDSENNTLCSFVTKTDCRDDQTTTGNSSAGTYTKVEIEGNVVDFGLTRDGVREDSFVPGSSDVLFGGFTVDTEDSKDDIDLDWVELVLTTGSSSADVAKVDNCELMYDGSRVADSRDISSFASGVTSGTLRFRFDNGTEVRAGREATFNIVCDIDDTASASDTYQFITLVGTAATAAVIGNGTAANPQTAAVPASADYLQGRVDYSVNREDFTDFLDSDSAESIAITGAGTLATKLDNSLSDTVYALAVGEDDGVDNVEAIEVELEAENEDIIIREIFVTDVTLVNAKSGVIVEDVLDRAVFTLGGRQIAESSNLFDGNYTEYTPDAPGTNRTTASLNTALVGNSLYFEDVNYTLDAGDEVTFDIALDFNHIDDNDSNSGVSVSAAKVIVIWEGVSSDKIDYQEMNITTSDYSRAVAFKSIPTISSSSRTQTLSNGNDKSVYEFSIAAASAGDVYVKRVSFDVTPSTGLDLTGFVVKDGTDTLNGSPVADDASNKVVVTFDEALRVRKGNTKRLTLRANIAGAGDDKSVVVELSSDANVSTTYASAAAANYAVVSGQSTNQFVWSPNSLNKDESIETDNTDWFSGATVYNSDDTESWTTERN